MIKNIIRVAGITLLILLVPLILQLTIGTGVDGQGFNWKLGDFVVVGLLIFLFGLIIDHARRKITDPTRRVFTIGLIIFIFLLVYAELAVGIFGTPFAGS